MLVPTTLFGLSGWRWVIIFGALFSLAIWFIRKKLPESARWLESKGRHDDAHTVMCEMEARCGLTPSPKHAHAAQSVVKRGTFREIWAPEYRQRTLMLMVMNFFQRSVSSALATGCRRCSPVRAPASPIACCTPSLSPSPIRWAVCSAPASCIALKTSGRLSSPR